MKVEGQTLDDRLRLLESCVRGIVMEIDEQYRYVEVWTHDEKLLARPRAELIGATIRESLGPEVSPPFEQLVRNVLATQAPLRLEYPLTVQSGPRWFAAEAFPGRRARTAVLLIQDITDRKQMEARLIESDRLAAIGLLAGGVGHEINNPLAWVMTQLLTLQAELITRSRDGNPDFARWAAQLSEALEGSERIRQIVRDLSFFTRSPETESTPVDLKRALDWAADMSMAELRHRARLVKVYGQSPMVLASEARLGQVFLNLLINAAQSIDEGATETNEVRIELSTDDQGRARIDVIDTGKGIAKDHVQHLFDPFFTTKPRGAGTGLGLTVSRRIIDSLSGELDLVMSQRGQTRFRVTLPAASETALRQRPAPSHDAPPRLTHRLKLLLIDDQARFLSSLQLALAPVFDIETESSARAALSRLRNGERYDAVVCDLMMPDFTGMDFFEALRVERPELAQRVVFMTGGAYSVRARAFLDTCPNARIDKPFRPEQLEAVLVRVCAPTERELH